MKIYAAQYTDCYFESSYETISLHFTKREALYALVLRRREEIFSYMGRDDANPDSEEWSYHSIKDMLSKNKFQDSKVQEFEIQGSIVGNPLEDRPIKITPGWIVSRFLPDYSRRYREFLEECHKENPGMPVITMTYTFIEDNFEEAVMVFVRDMSAIILKHEGR